MQLDVVYRNPRVALERKAVSLALALVLLPAHALAGQPDQQGPPEQPEPEQPEPEQPEPEPTGAYYYYAPRAWTYPSATASIGIGSHMNERRTVLSGDVLVGIGPNFGVLLVVPTFGWSGWRTLDDPSQLRANTFTGRLDLGYFYDGWRAHVFTISGAGRIGTGRGPSGVPTELYGAQVGVLYSFAASYGAEFQTHFINYLGSWHTEFRFVISVNVLGWLAEFLVLS
jgi:hypothetical protein